jgi:hypothetical protein
MAIIHKLANGTIVKNLSEAQFKFSSLNEIQLSVAIEQARYSTVSYFAEHETDKKLKKEFIRYKKILDDERERKECAEQLLIEIAKKNSNINQDF